MRTKVQPGMTTDSFSCGTFHLERTGMPGTYDMNEQEEEHNLCRQNAGFVLTSAILLKIRHPLMIFLNSVVRSGTPLAFQNRK
jgi:hypothetical protein